MFSMFAGGTEDTEQQTNAFGLFFMLLMWQGSYVPDQNLGSSLNVI